jgi:hypothetical protein
MPPLPLSYDEPLRLKIIELHVWAVNEGLRGTEAAQLFDGLCQSLLDAGVPLWRAFAGMRTLHPQWGDMATPGGASSTRWSRANSCAATNMRAAF